MNASIGGVFRVDKPIIGMLHLNGFTPERVHDWAKREIEQLYAGGVDAVLAEDYFGTPEDVEADVKRCFEQAWDSPKGYILATGCGIPNAAPAENVFRFMDAARRYGSEAARILQDLRKKVNPHGTD